MDGSDVHSCSVRFAGCGLSVHGSTQDLPINTIPQGATATIGMQTCVTPCTLKVQRSSETMQVKKGNSERTFDMEKDFNVGTTMCGNVLWLLQGAGHRYHVRGRLGGPANQSASGRIRIGRAQRFTLDKGTVSL
jgi:hypothetical protein